MEDLEEARPSIAALIREKVSCKESNLVPKDSSSWRETGELLGAEGEEDEGPDELNEAVVDALGAGPIGRECEVAVTGGTERVGEEEMLRCCSIRSQR